MIHNFAVGQKVRLTESMRRAAYEPEKYQTGIVTRVGSWDVYDVKWSGFDHPISVHGDEIEEDEE